MSHLEWVVFRNAFLTALVLTPIFRDVFRSYDVVDRPAQRKVHAYPTPRVGGIPIAIACLIGLLGIAKQDTTQDTTILWLLLPGAAIVFLVGLIDDFVTLRPIFKLLGLVLAAVVAYACGVRINAVAHVALPVWVSLPLTVGWLLLTANALNLIDGLDGLCAGIGLAATITLCCAAWLQGNVALVLATLPMAGALVGFLAFNLSPATIFLGDSGALLIGFVLGCYGVIWTTKMSTLVSMLVPLLALSVPLLDVGVSIVRRLISNQPVFAADRGHIHHRLVDRGLSARQAVWVLYLFATLAAGFVLLATRVSDGRYHLVAVGGFSVAAVVGIRHLRYAEFETAGRLLFGGQFARSVDLYLRLKSLRAALAGCASEEAWWKALVQGARDLGFASIRWDRTGTNRSESLRLPAVRAWSFQIPLGAAGLVEVTGSLETSQTIDLVALAQLVRQTCPSPLAAEPMAQAAAANS